ncbi:hypothetical protein FRC11_014852, partial [Ceratobasidium sp. 423]
MPPAHDLHPALVAGSKFILSVRNHFTATVGHQSPEARVTRPNPNPNVRGVQRALFVGSAPLVPPPPAVRT